MSTRPNLFPLGTITTMQNQSYERYLPTAFDESLTLLEKVNKIIYTLNEIGGVTNGAIEKWNEVLKWVMNDGLNESIVARLNDWLADGTLADIINFTIFEQLNAEVNKKQDIAKLHYIDVKQLKDREKLSYTDAFQKALDVAKTVGSVHLIFPAKERVVLTRELKVYQNTTIEAEAGVVFVREHGGYMLMNGNRASESNPSNFLGYTGHGNISIIGGTWDGNGVNFTSKASIFHFAHGDGFNVTDTTLLDCANSHHIEFNACRDIHVTNTKFLGLVGASSLAVEAIQLDVAKRGSTFIGSDDGTPCKDVWIENCYFGRSKTVGSGNIARGIGSHTATSGSKQKNINIISCTFDRCESFAIRCLNYEEVTITGNTFLSCGAGINVRANMTGVNTEDRNGVQVGAEEIRGFVISENIFEKWGGTGRFIEVYGERDTNGYIRGVTVSNNVIDMEGIGATFDAICFVVAENISCIGNTIKNAKGSAIALNTANSVLISANDINTAGDDAIQVISCYYTTIVGNNVIKTGANGIYIASSEAFTISSNIISGPNGLNPADPKNHIRVVTEARLGTIIGNIFRNFSTSHTTAVCIYVTGTCLNIISKDNVGVGFTFANGATNRAVDANGNLA